MQWRGVRRPSVCLSDVCKLLRKSVLLAGKWPDRDQTFTGWSPGEPASRVCSRSRSRSKVPWYGHFFGFLEWATPSLTFHFLKFFRDMAHKPLNGEGCGTPQPLSRGPLTLRRLPYMEIKLTFECTARFYGPVPPLLVAQLNDYRYSKLWYFDSSKNKRAAMNKRRWRVTVVWLRWPFNNNNR